MSKKHFQKLAYELMAARPDTTTNPEEMDSEEYGRLMQWRSCVEAVANACAQSNSAFDCGRFIEACEADKYSPGMHGR